MLGEGLAEGVLFQLREGEGAGVAGLFMRGAGLFEGAVFQFREGEGDGVAGLLIRGVGFDAGGGLYPPEGGLCGAVCCCGTGCWFLGLASGAGRCGFL